MTRWILIVVVALAVLALLTGCPKPVEQPTTIAPDAQLPPTAAPAAPAAEKPADEKGVKVEGEEGKPVVKTDSGLEYVVLEEGTGAKPNKGDKVIAEYTGWLTDGTKFDSSKDHAGEFDFNVGMGQVIPSWDEALLAMKEGERRKLIVPPALGYGAEGTPGGPIPPNATLVFEVKLVKIVK